MAILRHVQSLWMRDLPFLGPSARIEVVEGGRAPVLWVHDPDGRQQASATLDGGLLAGADFLRDPVAGETRALSLGGQSRSLDRATLDRLGDAPGGDGAALHLDGRPFAGNLVAVESVAAGGRVWLALAPSSGSGLFVYALPEGTGGLGGVQTLADTADRHLAGVSGLASVAAHGQTWLVAASSTENGLSVLRLGSGGQPVHTDAFGAADELPVHRPTAVAAVATPSGAFVVLASAGTSSLTVLSLSGTGQLAFVDQVIDTRESRFAGVTAIDTLTVGGRVLVAAGGADGGVSLLELLPGGRLVHRDTLVDGTGTALQGVTGLRFATVGGVPELLVKSDGDAGLARLRLDLGPQGAVGGASAATDGGDLLSAASAGGALAGGEGADVLLDGAGTDALRGGTGADLFVFRPDGRPDTIGDFDPREDRIDLTQFQGLYAAGVRITSTTNGARLAWGDESIGLYTADRAPLSVGAVAAALRWDVHRVGMPDTARFLTLRGSAGADTLLGTNTNETLWGLDGGDWLCPGAGSDRVDGGAGTDMVSYADLPRGVDASLYAGRAVSGADTDILLNVEGVTGTVFGDLIRGNGHANRLRGLGDYDWFVATWGGDSYDGGTGRDMVSYVDAPQRVVVDLGGGRGLEGMARGDSFAAVERVTGSIFSDLFYGAAGEEDFRGLGGDDWFVGGAGGKDRYDGGTGADTVAYFASPAGVVASLLLGRGSAGDAARDLYAGIESLTGSSHDDHLTGDNGRNTLRGLAGRDALLGNGGNDRLWGGGGDDTLDGGSGWDYAEFDGRRANYALSRLGTVTRVDTPGAEGTDSLRNVEVLVFSDGLVYL